MNLSPRQGAPRRASRFAQERVVIAPAASKMIGMRAWMGAALASSRLLTALAATILLILPDLLGVRLPPCGKDETVSRPVYSRLDFYWLGETERQKVEYKVIDRFTRFYDEDPDWLLDVVEPAHVLVLRACELAAAGKKAESITSDLRSRAEAFRLELKDAELAAIAGELAKLVQENKSFSLDKDLWEHVSRIFHGPQGIYNLGVLDKESFAREKDREIKVVRANKLVVQAKVDDQAGVASIDMVPGRIEAKLADEKILPKASAEFRKALSKVFIQRLRPTLIKNVERSQEELNKQVAADLKAASKVEKGTLLLDASTPATIADSDKLTAESEAFEAQRGQAAWIGKMVGKAALIFLVAIGFLLYAARFQPQVFRSSGKLLGIVGLGMLVLLTLRLIVAVALPLQLPLLGFCVGVAALVFGASVGVMVTNVLMFTAFLIFSPMAGEILAFIASGWVFSCLVPNLQSRTSLVRASFTAGFFGAAIIFGVHVAGGLPPMLVLGKQAAWCGGNWLLVGMLLTLALPIIEKTFGTVTNITLLELSDQEHPCLRRLVLEAAGTYHHSVVTGILAENGAEAVGANPLLARVGSYYHDIGKLVKPEYFTENDFGRSRHDYLAPTLSSLIISSHVKDGVDLALAHNLPQDIVDIIRQHHGDSVIQFFYQRAREQAADPSQVQESAFRYPGPKPQGREAGIVLLADSVEAACRSLEQPTSSHIERLVHAIVLQKLTDRQLDHSTLTFRDIFAIEQAFVRTLCAMYHSRVRYPEAGKQPQGRR